MGMKKIGVINNPPQQKDTERVSLTKLDHPKNEADEGRELTEELVFEALKGVRDPEIPVDIVNLGLIYDVSVKGRNVHIKLTLTTPGCHMSRTICQQAEQAIRKAGARDVMAEIVWDPPWNPDMMSDEAKEKLGML